MYVWKREEYESQLGAIYSVHLYLCIIIVLSYEIFHGQSHNGEPYRHNKFPQDLETIEQDGRKGWKKTVGTQKRTM